MMGSENLKSKERSINTDVFDNDNVDLSLSADNNPFKETLVKNNIGGNNIRLLTTDTPAVQPTGQPIMVSKFYLCTWLTPFLMSYLICFLSANAAQHTADRAA